MASFHPQHPWFDQVASGGLYELRVVQSGAKASRINVCVALDGEKAFGSSGGSEEILT